MTSSARSLCRNPRSVSCRLPRASPSRSLPSGPVRSVVGVTDYCNYPPEAKQKPHVGGMTTPSIETIAALRPDLILVSMEGNLQGGFLQPHRPRRSCRRHQSAFARRHLPFAHDARDADRPCRQRGTACRSTEVRASSPSPVPHRRRHRACCCLSPSSRLSPPATGHSSMNCYDAQDHGMLPPDCG